MGVVAHVRTVTHIRGTKTQTKLKAICPNCPISYTVRRELPINKLKVNSYSNYNISNIYIKDNKNINKYFYLDNKFI